MEEREFLAASVAGAVTLGTEGLPLPRAPEERAARRVGLVGGRVVEEVLEPELIA